MRDGTIARRALLGFVAAGLFGGRGSMAARRRQPPPHIVAIDPGHGGADPGAISPSRLYEKDITLDTALILARRLNASERFRAVLTRRGDVYVPLRNRIMRARARHAELFVSIHADMLPNPDIRGLSVYTLSEAASDRQAAALAARENKDDFTGLKLSRRPPDVGSVLLDLSRHETNNRSLAFAHDVIGELGRIAPLLEKPQRSAGFAVLAAADIPSVLVELGCLSNRDDERLLEKAAHRERLAAGLMRAVETYFASSAGVALGETSLISFAERCRLD
jgi:N-acetylmuramoyl-L-alanine amidase